MQTPVRLRNTLLAGGTSLGLLIHVPLASAALVGYWPMEEGTGSSTASAVNAPAHNGTLNGALWITENLAPVASGTSAAIELDALAGDTVTTGYEGIAGTAARTVAAWIRAEVAVPEFSGLVAWGANSTGARNTFRLNRDASNGTVGALRFEVSGGYVTGVTAVNDGLWHHVAMALPASATVGNVRLYVDGVLEPSFSSQSGVATAVNTVTSSTTPVTIGGIPTATTYNFHGAIDEVRLYDQALTDEEIAALAAPAPDLILSFTADPPLIDPGQTSTLRWEVPQFDTITIDQEIGDVSSQTVGGLGSITVTPNQSTLYIMTVTRGLFTDTRSVTVFFNAPGDVRINEVVADNQNTLDDEDGDDPDWIELKNYSGTPQSLEGWHLTDDAANLAKWTFPAFTLGPGEIAVVFASGKDRRTPGSPLHTNFRLETDGDYLALVKPDGVTIAFEYAPALPPLYTDVSYGIDQNGTDRVFFLQPTPKIENGPGTDDLGAHIVSATDQAPRPNRTVGHGPLDEQLLVTALVRPTRDPITAITLHYRVMFEAEIDLPMADDGQGPDAAPADGLYSAAIPLSGLLPGEMIRWRITATDLDGTVSRFPSYYDQDWSTDDTSASPEYFGTVAQNPSVQTSLPLLEWFVLDPAAAGTRVGTRASVYYLDQFYDNIYVRVRGGTTASLAKRSYKFDFNRGDNFRFQPGQERVSEINLNTTYTDKTYVRQNVSFELYDQAGSPGCVAFPVRIDQNGAFHSVATLIEQPDEDLLEREGLDPRGALYKMFNAFTSGGSGVEKKTRQWENNSDLISFVNNINTLTGAALETFIFDHVNVPRMMNYQAATVLSQNNDCMAKNYYAYRDSDGSGEWFLLPWDVDLTFGRHYMTDDNILGDTIWAVEDYVLGGAARNVPIAPSHPFMGTSNTPGNRNWHRLIDALFRSPKFTELYRRRLRTLMDQLLQPPETPLAQRQLEARLDAWAALLGNDAILDRAKWGQFGTPQTLEQAMTILKEQYLDRRRPHLFQIHLEANAGSYPYPNSYSTLLPPAQPPGLNVELGDVDYNPASGNQNEEYVQLVNPYPFAVDLSGWTLSGGIDFELPPGAVIPANDVLYVSPHSASFRARATGPRGGQGLLVLGNYRGQLSARGETVVLQDPYGRPSDTLTYPGSPSDAQQFLRVTEIQYNPSPLAGSVLDPQEFEFIELKNIGAFPLDLSGTRFVTGIQFDFGRGTPTILPAGARLLLVKNLDAFTLRYGATAAEAVSGTYTGSLDNAGERLRLVDAQGEEILDFSYNDKWHPVTDGLGFSLVVVDENAEPDAWNNRTQWRPSGQLEGSPGQADPGPAPVVPVVINEALTRSDTPPPTDSIELFNPTATEADLSGWFLTDDFKSPKKYQIPPGTLLPGGQYLVLTEADFNANPGTSNSFALSSLGDEVYLFAADAPGNLLGYVHGHEFGAALDGVTFGRLDNSQNRELFLAQSSPTLGAPNAGPQVGPLLFSEIMYHPAAIEGANITRLEYVEIHNRTDTPVDLFDPLISTNTWQVSGGIDFVFPPAQTVAPGERVLLVNFDPVLDPEAADAFRDEYGVGASVRLFGPYGGNLDNGGESIQLTRPTTPQLGVVPQVLVEEVDYRDEAPWPVEADGSGLALQRFPEPVIGNDPAHWFAGPPTPGNAPAAGAAPVITLPPADQTVQAETEAVFQVAATGDAPLRYQWRFRGSNLTGATGPSLALPHVGPENYGNYQVLVYNNAGAVLSQPALLAITYPITILSQPQSQTVRPGTNVTFTVAAFSSATLSYQWRKDGQPLPGATGTSLNLTDVQPADRGFYDVVVGDGLATVTSNPARLELIYGPLILVNPLSQTVVQGGQVTLSVEVEGTLPMGFRWRKQFATIKLEAGNATRSFVTLTNVQAADGGSVPYSVIITNAASYTPGVLGALAYLEVLPDADGDLMPDGWETLHGFNPNEAGDASLDADGDHQTNRQEYQAGTHPHDPDSLLVIDRVSVPGAVTIDFQAASNLTYTVQSSDALTPGLWTTLAEVVAHPTNRTVTVLDPQPTPSRFYRLVTPRQQK